MGGLKPPIYLYILTLFYFFPCLAILGPICSIWGLGMATNGQNMAQTSFRQSLSPGSRDTASIWPYLFGAPIWRPNGQKRRTSKKTATRTSIFGGFQATASKPADVDRQKDLERRSQNPIWPTPSKVMPDLRKKCQQHGYFGVWTFLPMSPMIQNDGPSFFF